MHKPAMASLIVGSIIIVLFLGGLGYYLYNNSERPIFNSKEVKSCNSNSDCITVIDACNHRQSINKKYEQEWNNNVKEIKTKGGTICALYADTNCNTTTSCINSECKWSCIK